MAVPKKRTSRSRKLKRRTHWKLAQPCLSRCVECDAPTLPHRVCRECGSYGSRRVVAKTTE